MPRGNVHVTDEQINEIFQRNHGGCAEAQAFERAAGGYDDDTALAVFRDLTQRRYPVTARHSGAE